MSAAVKESATVPQTTVTTMLAIASITIDGGTQSRVELDETTIDEYAAQMTDGAMFPPVIVFRDPDDKHWLADGFHRVAAAQRAGHKDIAADVRTGKRRHALWYSLSANATHGLPRTNADKRRVVMLALDHADGRKMSDRALAKHCGVGHAFVSKVRSDMQVSTVDTSPRTGRDGKEQKPQSEKRKRAAQASAEKRVKAKPAAVKNPRKSLPRVEIVESDEDVVETDDGFATDASDPVGYHAAYLLRAAAAVRFAVYVGAPSEDVSAAAKLVVSAWLPLAIGKTTTTQKGATNAPRK